MRTSIYIGDTAGDLGPGDIIFFFTTVVEVLVLICFIDMMYTKGYGF